MGICFYFHISLLLFREIKQLGKRGSKMCLLIFGLTMWSCIHLFSSIAKGTRENIISKLGLGPYKGIFAVLIVSSVILIVFGWRSIEPTDIYLPQSWGRHVTFFLVLLTFILFFAARRKTNIKRILRHPQLAGLVLWGIGHLFSNGDNRSLILFSWLTIWAALEMFMINRREGEWIKPESVIVKNDVITVIGGCVVYAIFLMAHPYLSGIKLIYL
jgi:uncharacterized membrane protein